jgi:predicted choloylglycine hydrolase
LTLVLILALVLSAGARDVFQPTSMTLSGDHFEMGRQFGEQYRNEIGILAPGFLSLAAMATATSEDQIKEHCRELAKGLREEDREELRGLAEGSKLEPDLVLFLNLFYTVTGPRAACRQLAVWGDASVDGRLLHARNLDWHDYPGKPLQRHNVILRVRGDGNDIEFLMLTWPGYMCALTGLNREGIGAAFNKLPGAPALTGSEPTFFTIKRVLRSCRTLEEAVALIETANPMDNGSILLSDSKSREAIVVETRAGKTAVRRASGGMIGNANHYTRECGLGGDGGLGAGWPVLDAAAKIGAKHDVESLKKIMAAPEVLQRNNLLSVIFDPSNNRMWLASGTTPAASRGPFLEIPIFEDAVVDAASRALSQ